MKERDNVHISQIKDKKKYLNVNSHVNSSSKKPYRYKVLSVVQETDKGEVGDSSSPRPTIFSSNRRVSDDLV